MFVPEFLIKLSQRDQQVTWLDPVLLANTATAAAAQVIVEIIDVPDDRVLILQSVNLTAAPNAAQNIVNMQLDLLAPAGTFVSRLTNDSVAKAAGIAGDLDWQSSIIVPPNWKVRAIGNFNAGAAANSVTGWLQGVLIPVANFQRV